MSLLLFLRESPWQLHNHEPDSFSWFIRGIRSNYSSTIQGVGIHHVFRRAMHCTGGHWDSSNSAFTITISTCGILLTTRGSSQPAFLRCCVLRSVSRPHNSGVLQGIPVASLYPLRGRFIAPLHGAQSGASHC